MQFIELIRRFLEAGEPEAEVGEHLVVVFEARAQSPSVVATIVNMEGGRNAGIE